jgi:SPP1 family predicted phage head-tail adaptor
VSPAGRLRHRLTLEQAVTSEDGSGGYATEWLAVASLWGAIETISGREWAESDAVKSEATHRIAIRHRDDIGPSMRLRFYGRVFDIESLADPDGRRRHLLCRCVEKGV